MSKDKPFRVVLSGPDSHERMILTVDVRESDEAYDLSRHLQQAFPSSSGKSCWRSTQEYGYSYISGKPNEDVTPFLRPLAVWLKGRNVTEIVVVGSSPTRLRQIRKVFPDAVVL